MKNIIKYSTILSLLIIIFACSNDILDETPQGVLTEEQILKNKSALEALVTSTYAMLDGMTKKEGARYEYSASCTNTTFGDMVSDDATKGGGGITDQSGMHSLEVMQANASISDLSDKWKALYEGINRANTAIRLISKSSAYDDGTKEKRLGELRLLRGFFHFEAKKIFEKVVWLDETYEDYNDIYGVENNLADDDFYNKIEEDYTVALNVLPAYSSGEPGRVDKGVATACLAKLALYQKDWEAVIGYCDAVASLGYDLCDDFYDNFDGTKQNMTPEAIFQIQFGEEAGNVLSYNTADRLINYGYVYGNSDFLKPSQDLVDAFATDTDGHPVKNITVDATTISVDVRLDHTVLRDGAPIFDVDTFKASWGRAENVYPPYGCKKKIAPAEYYLMTYPRGSAINHHIIRYAEVLLWKAEALAMLNKDYSTITSLVNKIRERAKNSRKIQDVSGTIDYANYKTEPYTTDFSNQDEALEAIRLERRLELAFEGHRFFDLVRWGITARIMNDYFAKESSNPNGSCEYLKTATFTEGQDEYFPIPQTEIDKLGLTQNRNQ